MIAVFSKELIAVIRRYNVESISAYNASNIEYRVK
jgi:hypothetical protein